MILRTLTLLMVTALPLRADPPKVVTDIPAVHSIASALMAGVGMPSMLLKAGETPHNFSMRPSQAHDLQNADLVVWMGHGLTPQLEDPIETLATNAEVMELLEIDRLPFLEVRASADFGDDHHDHGHGNHKEPGHDDHKDEDHAGHEHDDHKDGHDNHAGHDHRHGAGGQDPHAWLDPKFATMWAQEIAARLIAADMDNADTYKANLASFAGKMSLLDLDLKAVLAEARDTPFIATHDALYYFESAYGLNARGALANTDAAPAGPERMAAIRAALSDGSIKCALVEAGTSRKGLEAVAPAGGLTFVEIDQVGLTLEPGPALYGNLLRGLADAVKACPS
ncbi:MAG: zinc ABC transporter substrate-binding protein [Rhodobacteraceae bacterium]|nr:zinc ABC transporter substrate-binding protein [Paracoccaceae bacterium]